jgi:integrase
MPKRKDELPRGLILRGTTYWADFYQDGKRIRRSLETGDKKGAEKRLTELRARLNRGDYGLLEKDRDYPLADLRRAYLRDCEQTLKPNTAIRYRRNLEAVWPDLPPMVSQLGVEVINAHRERRLGLGISPGTINSDVSRLSGMLDWGVEWGLIEANPLAKKVGFRGSRSKVKRLPHDHKKEGRALTDEEVKRLLDKSPDPWRDIWYAMLVTGLRKGELANLLFDDIDWESKELEVHRGVAKNHAARRIPIEPGLWAIIERKRVECWGREPGRGRTPEITAQVRARFTTDHVFTTTENTPLTHGSSLYWRFLSCCKLAGIETRRAVQGREIDHVDLHSLRRTFATNLIVNGADPKSVQKLLGHKTLEMTMNIYAKIHAGTIRETVGRLSYGGQVEAREPAAVRVAPGARARAGARVVPLRSRGEDGHKLVTTPHAKEGVG